MKTFWALIVVLIASTSVLLAMRNDGHPSGASTLLAADTPRAVKAKERPDTPEAVESTTDTKPDSLPESASTTPPNDPTSDTKTTVVGVGIPEAPFDPRTLFGDPTPFADDDAVSNAAPDHNDPAPTDTPDTPTNAPDTRSLGERYTLAGDGTAEDPYVITFDMLVAVEHDYAPKIEGKAEIPEWIKALDGKHVSITGFVAFPFLSATADECMVMLNQWDGCCIGVPPTPYDAVEVQFTEPLDLNRGIPNYGTISGVFRTDPYLVNGWLIGLYVMDNATLINSGSKNQSGF